MSRPSLLAAALGALLLSACGGLDTPVAPIAGRIVGARAGAYAYPLGRPDLKVAVALPDGSFRLEAVPTSVSALVLYDGADRAERVDVQVNGGETTRVADRYGADATLADEALRMPLAGTILAGVQPEGGATPGAPSFTVLETDHEGLPSDTADEGVATVYPLPAGRFELEAALTGFRGARGSVEVLAGATVSVQLRLPVDDGAEAPGCGSAPGCENGLHCSDVDGRCYACTATEGCESGETCDLANGLCRPDAGPATGTCLSCTDGSGCASGVCVVPAGETAGYCSLPCAAGCPAGFACGASGSCEAPDGCADWLQTMGSICVDDEACAGELAGGRCERVGDAPGYCTAPCAVDADCRIGTGTAATLVCTGGFCAPP